MSVTNILLIAGTLCSLAGIAWLIVERGNVPYVRAQQDAATENRVIWATLVSVIGIVLLAAASVFLAFSA